MPVSSNPAPLRQRQRVVITGMGTVNALTSGGKPAVAEAIALGRSGIGPLRAFAPDPGTSGLAAEVDDARLAALVDPAEARRLSRICRLAVAACRLAIADAGVGPGPGLAIVVGSEHGDFRSSEEFAGGYLQRGPAGLSPMIFPNTVMNTMASVASIAVGARAPSVTLNQATIVGDLAVARAAAIVARGDAQAAVAGGVDEICALVHRQLCGLGVLSPMGGEGPEGCRPYAADHNGPVLGEGATFVVLERLDTARARGAEVIAEIADQAWGNVPVPAHAARPGRADRGSPVGRLLAARAVAGFRRVYGAGNGDAGVDDWERGLLARDLGSADVPPLSLAPLFGQHGGLGALRVAAAALDAARGVSPVLVHGIARGGCRTALIIASLDPRGDGADRGS
jgi:3-oxoacyl-[acyl-carrier-protein] synthase II